MPYGTETKKGDSSLVKYQIKTPYGTGYTFTTMLDGFENNRRFLFRSGTNAPSRSFQGSPRPPITFVEKQVTLYKGPKLSTLILVYSRRLKKYVWVRARQPIVVRKLVKVFPPKRKKVKGLDLPPNKLVFRDYKLTGGGAEVRSISAPHNSVTGYSKEFTANFLYPGAYPGGSFPFPPYLFTQHWIESQYGERWQAARTLTNDRALNKLYEKVKNMDVNVGQILAESRQTATLIASTAVRVAQIIHRLRQGDLAGATGLAFPSNAGATANAFLAWQYGVKPLLQDIDGMMKHLASNARETVFDIVSRKTVEIEPETLQAGNGSLGGNSYLTMSGSVTTVYKARIQITNRNQTDLVNIGLLNAPVLAWELLPYSFVIDWFLPIGGFLNNLDAFVGLEVISCHRTTILKRDITLRRNFGGTDGDGYVVPSFNEAATFKQTEVTRDVLPTVPELPFVSFKNPLGYEHAANALALITSLVTRRS